MTSADQDEIARLQEAISVLEAQRAMLGDAVVDASLEALKQQLAQLQESKQEIRQQRKLATILFTDIVGHTKLVQHLDPEENLIVIDGALVRLAAVVEAHGGHIARYQGDGFKAVFGLPTAEETDPQNAVRAGLGIVKEAQIYARQIQQDWGLTGFNVRVGIDTGLIVAGGTTEAEDTIKGLVVNLAARLESAAPPGGVLISHHTYQHVRGIFDVEALASIQAKGFSDPVPVYLVKGARSRTFRDMSRGVEGVQTRMVGRDGQLVQLQEAFRAAVTQAQGTVITISGEAGVGKSRLLFEFEKWLGQGPHKAIIFRGRASPQTRGSAQYLWRELLASHFQILDSDPLAIVQQKFTRGVAELLGHKGEMKAHLLGSWLGYDFADSLYLVAVRGEAEQLRRRALLYLTQYFGAVATAQPTVIMLEDIHWADKGSLDAVAELAAKGSHLPLFILCLARPSLFQRQPGWGDNLPQHTHLQLTPLSSNDTADLVAHILRHLEPLSPLLLDMVSTRAEGNPFYAEELIKMLIDIGSIVITDDNWLFKPEKLDALDVPTTLTGVLQARIDHLQPEEKEALQQASVIGRIFWDRTLEALPREGERYLPLLETKEYIFAQASSAFAESIAYIFKHALLRDVAYETVLLRLRRDYHGRIARWLEENAQGRLDEFAGLIANHYTQASVSEKAAFYWERAGDVAFRTGNFSGARDAFEQARALVPRAEVLRSAELAGKLAAALPILRELESAERVYRQALELLAGQAPRGQEKAWQRLRLNFMLGLMDTLYFQHRPKDMEAMKGPLETLLEEVGTLKQKSDYYARLGQIVFLKNQYLLPIEHFDLVELSLSYAQQSGDKLLIARVYFHVGFHNLWYRNLAEAEQFLRQALETAVEMSDTWLVLQCQAYLSLVYRMQGDPQKLAELLPKLIANAQEIDYLSYLGVGQSGQAWLYYEAGDWAQAENLAHAALASWKTMTYPIQWPAQLVLLAAALRDSQVDKGVAAAHALLDPGQQQLPGQITDMLHTALRRWEKGTKAETETSLNAAVDLAQTYGYL